MHARWVILPLHVHFVNVIGRVALQESIIGILMATISISYSKSVAVRSLHVYVQVITHHSLASGALGLLRGAGIASALR
jgi:hypothetical protein